MSRRIVCENLRSAYNVGNIIRTADGLGWGVVLVGYTAPIEHKKVSKTALGAEQLIPLIHFTALEEFYVWVKKHCYCLVSLEITPDSHSLDEPGLVEYIVEECILGKRWSGLCVVVGNEVVGVEGSTLSVSDYHISIPMFGIKESFNVGQAAAIAMWEMRRNTK
ncbi:MAG TPA: TrmH family RNA methyltransferase [Candidatus Absconditabacterales bacterium]|nr:TrmH family RNA methyltransferase [Candidatus Absconditabacterales bacterium]